MKRDAFTNQEKVMAAAIKPIYLELSALANTVTLAEATIQKLVREGAFPAPRQLSGRRVAWLVREVEEWAEQRPVSTLPPPPNTGKRKSKQDRERGTQQTD